MATTQQAANVKALPPYLPFKTFQSSVQNLRAHGLLQAYSRTNRILNKATSMGLFTVGNDADFVPSGGMAALVVESRKIVLEVNSSIASNTGWSISSHLLEVARRVNGASQ